MARENESCSRTVVSNCLRGILRCFSAERAVVDSFWTVDYADRDLVSVASFIAQKDLDDVANGESSRP
ncbi:unnamed protein product [Sphenostylis stenocarpa]|uniref:Uncharacterized protein n=1 Tax=Sphenostylis stenocarpa TaxID=92480 RepID=A0AA86T177_9FABA|nr:unnamed protein product [Sphenostylis stenocarpa]